ncbi:hypothetical protein BGI05_05180 [Snodgrassella alvi]|nr:hypothetical protein BGH97_02550 [Snodgrassella alvi]ORF09378.1 hypothetical protein BGH99_02525 [Snodgrassella alvi]ORF14705.1 hypothetical protein BGI00_01820 [Snodgrassella alvi]ORF15901.1 hypothetical protein BGI02_01970 [Snodgrassella alvi]ORF21002.1 hypothetical protein BGI05_05180 [Snodgrassella alvi]
MDNMIITENLWKEIVPYKEDIAWFNKKFTTGIADLQEVLDELAKISDGWPLMCTILEKIPPSKTVIELDNLNCETKAFAGDLIVNGDLYCEGSILVAGGLKVKGEVNTKSSLIANLYKEGCAMKNIMVGGNINIGWRFKSNGDVIAGGEVNTPHFHHEIKGKVYKNYHIEGW